MVDDKGKGTGEPGWTPAEKGTNVTGDAGAAGEAVPMGRPTSAREETETAAAKTEREPAPSQPKP